MEEETPKVVDPMEDVGKYTQDVFKAVVAATRRAKGLPKLGDNYELYNSYPVFAELMKVEGERVLQLISKLLKHTGAQTNLLERTLLPEERMERLAEVNDFLLERVGNLLDEAAGLRRPEELIVVGPDTMAPLARTIAASWNRQIHHQSQQQSADGGGDSACSLSPSSAAVIGNNQESGVKRQVRLLGSFNVARPQLHFADHIDNSNKPFVPKLKFKHNPKERIHRKQMAIVDDGETVDTAGSAVEIDVQKPSHPYKYELDHFEPEPCQFDYPTDIQCAPPVHETPLVYVRTEKELEELCRTLKTVREFAVDLEHHSYRTFQGLTCLMQISTRTSDYIVDTLALWRYMHILNDPFTDPSIVKVLHGADMDVFWLQRDFGIYLVNMFDTGQAMRLLNLPRFALAYLVRHYCNGVELEKQFQLADWRIRPLPDELLMYARKDTHYLLTCYDHLRRDLIDQGNEQKNLLRSVYMRSRDICLKEYHKQLYDPDDYMELLAKSRKRFNSRQEYALKQLYAWRDHLARTEDESRAYILPDHMMLHIAEVLPREMQGIWACCSPVPPLVRQDSHTLHRIILHARALPLETTSSSDRIQQQNEATVGTTKSDGASLEFTENRTLMIKVHDFSHSSIDEEIIPLLQRSSALNVLVRMKQTLALSFFDNDQPPSKKRRVVGTGEWMDTMTPYERYLQAATVSRDDAGEKKEEKDGRTGGSRKRKMYSHLDPFVKNEGELVKEPNAEASTSAVDKPVQQEDNASPSSLPKKKRKPDVVVDDRQMDEMLTGKANKKKKKKQKPTVSLASYDYSTADKAQFSKGPTSQPDGVFEPHAEFMKKRGKKSKMKRNTTKSVTGTVNSGTKKKSVASLAGMGSMNSGFGKGKKKSGKW